MCSKDIITEYVYIFSVLLYCVIKLLSSTYLYKVFPFIDTLSNIIILGIVVLLNISFIISSKFSKKTWLYIFIIFILSMLILIKNSDKNFLVLILFIVTYPSTLEYKNIALKICCVSLITIFAIMVLSKMGIIYDYISYQRGLIRHGYGFISANALANSVSSALLIFLFFKKKNCKFIEYIIILLLLVFIYRLTGSRLAFYIGMLSVFISIYYKCFKLNKIQKNILYFLSKFIFLVLLLLSIFITIYIFKNGFNDLLKNMNSFFTGRLSEMINYYQKYGFHLIGTSISTVGVKEVIESGSKWMGIDMSYINFTLRYGLIFMFSLGIVFVKLGSDLKKYNLYKEATYVILMCIMALTENIFLIPYYNFSIFLIAYLIKSKGGYNKNEIK